jgi:hypothetical protein
LEGLDDQDSAWWFESALIDELFEVDPCYFDEKSREEFVIDQGFSRFPYQIDTYRVEFGKNRDRVIEVVTGSLMNEEIDIIVCGVDRLLKPID